MGYTFKSGEPIRQGPNGELLGGTYYPPGQEPKPEEVEGDPEQAKAIANALGMPWVATMIDRVQAGEQPFSSNVTIQTETSVTETENGSATVGDQTSESGLYDDAILRVARRLARENVSTALPLKNQLEEFASMSIIFGLGCVSPEELNFPDQTYRKNGIRKGQIVLKSGRTPEGKPRIYAEKRYGIDTGYFIDDVEVESVIAPNPRSRATNFFNINFKVFEPYSMGLFLQTLQTCARNAGYNNYLEAPWLLTMEFIGYDNDGKPISKSSLRKLLPLKFVTVLFDVDERGSHYNINCSAFSDESFTDLNQSIRNPITVTGKNLKEMLQTGINSLATHINTEILQEKKRNSVKHEVDEYIIAFPADNSSQNLLYALSALGENETATTGDLALREFTDEQITEAIDSAGINASGFQQADANFRIPLADQKRAFVEGRLGYSVQRGNLSEGIKKLLAGQDAPNNIIGNAPIDPGSPLGHGASPFGLANFAYNEETGLLERGNTTVDPQQRSIQFKPGTKIQKIIEDLILISDYGKLVAMQLRDSSRDMIDWFRIESQIYLIKDSEAEKVMGRMPRIYLYRVVPYQVHKSLFQMPNTAPTGYDRLTSQACKEYNYIYTGQNKDVLGFEIKFDNAFYRSIASDTGNNSASNSPTVAGNTEVPTQNELQGNPNVPQGDGRTVARENVDRGDNESASAIREDPDLRIARNFNLAVTNSDVDLITIDLEILGDPYFITDSGVGNYNADATSFINLNADGAINYQTSEVDIIINFRTPVDIDPETGSYKMDGTSLGLGDFSGLYKVNTINNMISGNVFKQVLQCVRRPNQQNATPENITTEPIVDAESDYQKRLDEAIASGNEAEIEFARADLNGDGRLQYWEVPDTERAQQLTRNRNTNPDGTEPSANTGTGSTYDDAILRQARASDSGGTTSDANDLDAFGGAGEDVNTGTDGSDTDDGAGAVTTVVEGVTDAVGSAIGNLRDLYYKYGGGRD